MQLVYPQGNKPQQILKREVPNRIPGRIPSTHTNRDKSKLRVFFLRTGSHCKLRDQAGQVSQRKNGDCVVNSCVLSNSSIHHHTTHILVNHLHNINAKRLTNTTGHTKLQKNLDSPHTIPLLQSVNLLTDHIF